MQRSKAQFANLISVCTDGAPAMQGVRKGFIGLLKKELPHPESLIAFHCILHQCNFAAKSATVGDTFNKVLEIVHFIRVNSTRHRQFCELLINDDETDIVDMSFYCQVCWLSQRNILSKIFKLKISPPLIYTIDSELFSRNHCKQFLSVKLTGNLPAVPEGNKKKSNRKESFQETIVTAGGFWVSLTNKNSIW